MNTCLGTQSTPHFADFSTSGEIFDTEKGFLMNAAPGKIDIGRITKLCRP